MSYRDQSKEESYAMKLLRYTLEIKDDNLRDSFCIAREHRLELVVVTEGVTYINDSKSTNVNSTWMALDSIDSPVVLVLGGVDKGNDYTILNEEIIKKVRVIVTLGESENIESHFSGLVKIKKTFSIKQCVDACRALARRGDTVLFSPACASFDLFEDYQDRGRKFKEEVRSF
jgi:UDP-N-acetylmuramoylalanine--D-glutamate ligase